MLFLSFTITAQNIATVAVVDFSNNTGRRIPNIESTASMGGYTGWEKKVNVYDGLNVNAVLGEKESSDQE